MLVALLSGCAPLGTGDRYAQEAVDYVCANNGGFRLLSNRDETTIVVAGMKFGLQREAAPDGTEVFSCSMLRLEQSHGVARVEMEGRPYLDNCSPQR